MNRVTKKILYYTDCYIFGGCENVLASLLKSPDLKARFQVEFSYRFHKTYQKGVDLRIPLDSKKHPLYIMSNESFFFQIDSTDKTRLLRFLIRLPFNLADRLGIYSLYNLFALMRSFRKMAPELIHINNGGYPGAASCRIAVLSAKLAGVPKIIFTVNNLATPPKSVWDRYLDKYVKRYVNTFVTASKQAKNQLIQNRQMNPEHIVQIYNTVQESQIVRTRAQILKEYGLPLNCFLIVEVAFLTFRKGQIRLLQAMVEIREKDPVAFEQLRLILVGDGEDYQTLQAFITEKGLKDKVFMAGFQAESSDFINASNLFVLPSIANEDMPLVVLDAMRLGKTIISTEVAGIVEEIRTGIDGLLLKPDDLIKLAETILAIYHNAPMASRLGSSARVRFQEMFSYQTFTRQYIDLYEKTLTP